MQEHDELVRAGISDLEIGSSARNPKEWDALIGAVTVMGLVAWQESQRRRALQVQRQLAQAGLRGRKVPDLLVAAAAEEQGLAVLHYDREFDHIATVTGQEMQWVVPVGSVD